MPEHVVGERQLRLEAGLSTYPLSLEAVLHEIDWLGEVEAYLNAAGVPADQLATLRAQAMAA